MSYITLTPTERDTFLAMQARGVRSPVVIREMRRDYPVSPAADRAESLLPTLTPDERAILDKIGNGRWRMAA